jgi:hypothetical protein
MPSLTPKAAILKYCKTKSFTYSAQNIKVLETKIVDPDYGKQFIVNGISGESGSGALFFYLKSGSKGWKVVSAGSGP